MKKFIVLLYVLLAALCFTQEIEWKVIRDSKTYLDETGFSLYTFLKKIEAGNIVKGIKTNVYTYETPYDFLLAFDNEKYYIDAEAVIPNGTTDLFDEALLTPTLNRQGKTLFSSNYLEILKTKKRNSALQIVPKGIKWYIDNMDEYSGPWWNPSQGIVGNTKIFQTILSINNFYNYAMFYITDIKKKENNYEIQVLCDRWYMRDTSIPQNKQPKQDDNLNYPAILTLYTDGDFIDIFYEDTWQLGSYAVVDKKIGDILDKLMRTNTCDLTDITWPHRADKNHSAGKSYLVVEALRLRKEENTTSATLQTMQPGTQVKILQLGKEQTIDGIKANWVQVQLANGVSGWCFGGYLVAQ